MRGTQERCAPQRVDLLGKAALRLASLEVGDPGIVEALELLAHAPDRSHDGAAPCFGGVRGEDGVDLEIRDEALEALPTELRAQLAERRGQRLRLWLRAPVSLAKDARAMVLLGEVGQVEVAGERAGNKLGALQRPRRDEPFRLTLVAAVVSRADDEPAQLFDVAQKSRAAVIGDDAAEQPSEQADIAPERLGDLLAGGLPVLTQAVWRRRTPGSPPARGGTPR